VTITLDLPVDLESRLAVDAARHGLSLSEYAVRLLAGNVKAAPLPVTGAELVAYWKDADVIGSRADIADPQAFARVLRTEAENRWRDDRAP